MRDAPRRVAVASLVALLCLSLVAPAVATVGPSDRRSAAWPTDRSSSSASQTGASVLAQSQVDADAVVMRVDVSDDGTAEWAVEFRVRLDDENATAAFESVQADLAENETAFTSQFATGMERTVRKAENATGREMAMENLTATATTEQLPREYGVLTYRFTWRNFAGVDGERLRVGDALAGLFLDAESTLVVAWPGSFALESAAPEPDDRGDGSVTWRGPAEFGPNEPRVVVAASGSGGGSPSTALLAAAGVLLVALLAGGWVVAGRLREDGDSDSDGGTTPAADTGGSAEAEGGVAGTGAERDGGTDAGSDEEGADGDGPPEELLSNEELVLRLLEDSGGRIKQQQIAAEYDWTDAKTSQVVGSLRDDDAVETFRIGRENVVALPGETDF